jgi:hypothetical protein
MQRNPQLAPSGDSTADRGGPEILDREQCLRLLAQKTLGRIGITVGALPVVHPVRYRLVRDEIILRATAGTTLDRATRDAVVAFEVDDMDATCEAGWSVSVTGTARAITEPACSPPTDERTIAITPTIISGRRFPADPELTSATGRPRLVRERS